MSTILYKWPEAWGLPSLDVACIQLEAYLRFIEHDYQVQLCSTDSSSPTGQLPALEHQRAAVASAEANPDAFAASRSAIRYLKSQVKDLDSYLTSGQRAEHLAFQVMFETRLNLATTCSIWYESSGYSCYRKAISGTDIPFPLSWAVSAYERGKVQRELGLQDTHKVYQEACEVLVAVADRLRQSGPFLLGARPCTADALLLGHLLFYHSSPAAAPVLRTKMEGLTPLHRYMETLLDRYFSQPAPMAFREPESADDSGRPASSSWSDAAQGKPRPRRVELTEAEKDQRYWSKWWAGGAAAAMGAYFLFSGNYLQFVEVGGDVEDEGDDDDDDVGED